MVLFTLSCLLELYRAIKTVLTLVLGYWGFGKPNGA